MSERVTGRHAVPYELQELRDWRDACSRHPYKQMEAQAFAGAVREIERLRAAAERVCWFDWSGNDADAVAAIAELRAALKAT